MIEIGDKVHVEFTVKDTKLGSIKNILRLERETAGGLSFHCIPYDDPTIVKHIPKPYDPEPGHFVCTMGGYHWEVVAVHCSQAWCKSRGLSGDKVFNFDELAFYGVEDARS